MSKHLNTLGWVGVLVLTGAFVTRTLANGTNQEQEPKQDLAKIVANLELRVDHLENKLKDARAERKKQSEAIEEVKKDATTLTQRFERLDRNTVGQMKRDVDDIEKEIDDLKKRVRRLE